MKKQKAKTPVVSEFTPGPWRTGEGSQWGAHNAIYCSLERETNPGRRLAIFYTPGSPSDSVTPEDRANARLAATAPEMLDALRFVSEFYQQYFEIMPVAFQTVDNIVCAAIAKAKGLDQ